MISLYLLQKQLDSLPQHQIEIIIEIHNIVASLCPDAVERIDRNGISYYDSARGGPVKAGICQVFFKPDHLRLAFIHGAFLPDPDRLLTGKTYPKRFIALSGYDKIPWESIQRLITFSSQFDPYTQTFSTSK
jgi:hypothetical protein